MKLFFGLTIETHWPKDLPQGKIIQEKERHVTLAFIGEAPLEKILDDIPPFPYALGPAGLFTKCLFFPPRHPHCVAWHIDWQQSIDSYQQTLTKWLVAKSLIKEPKRPITHHVTLSRSPFKIPDWKKSFSPRALYATGVHLFESLGFSTYRSHWSTSLLEPFTELEHTADVAFTVRGKDMHDLYLNAQIALCFRFPELIPFRLLPESPPDTLEEIVSLLNQIVSRCDSAVGSPLKAISFHGDVTVRSDALLEWEMIVDV